MPVFLKGDPSDKEALYGPAMHPDTALLSYICLAQTGDKIGQAAVFDQYELEDGTLVRVTSEAWQPAQVRFKCQWTRLVNGDFRRASK